MKMSKKRNLSDYDKTSLPDASKYKFGIVVSEWNEEITEGMFEGAKQTLIENGVPLEQIVRWNVPGSFELIYEIGRASCREGVEVAGVGGGGHREKWQGAWY